MDVFEQVIAVYYPVARGPFSDNPNVKWDEVGGLISVKKALEEYIVNPINNPKDDQGFGTCILLYGPPGCGKTKIAEAVANKAGASFIPIRGLAKLAGFSNSMKTVFVEARACAPCILFFDQVDAFSIKCGEEGRWDVEFLLSELQSELGKIEENRGVYVLGATNRPDLVHETLLTHRGFGKVLYVPLPSPEERGLILKAAVGRKKIDCTVDLMHLGKDFKCNNFSPADLVNLMNEAGLAALEDEQAASQSAGNWTIKDEHFKRALESVRMCESFAEGLRKDIINLQSS